MREFYRSQDKDLEVEVALAIKRLVTMVQHCEEREAIDAAKVVLPLLVHKEPDAPLVEIDMRDAEDGPKGPRVPQDPKEIGEYIAKLVQVGRDLELPGLGGAAARIEIDDADDSD